MCVMSLPYIISHTLLLIQIYKYICLNCIICAFKSFAVKRRSAYEGVNLGMPAHIFIYTCLILEEFELAHKKALSKKD